MDAWAAPHRDVVGGEPAALRARQLPFGTSLDELGPGTGDVLDGRFATPLALLRDAALEHNLSTMARYCAERGVALAPHGKTTMCPGIIRRQLEHGAWGVTVATPSQARVLREFGFSRLLLANELVDPAAARWAVREMAADAAFELTCYVDSAAGVELLESALAGTSPARRLPVLVELGYPAGRGGVRSPEDAEALAERVRRSPALALRGVSGWEGPLGAAGADAPEAVRGFARSLRSLAERCLTASAPAERDGASFVVTAGGSTWFEELVEVLPGGWAADHVEVVLRSGCYVVHDHGLYARSSAFARRPGLGFSLHPALELWGRVLSRPEPGLALVDVGRRDAGFDAGLPLPIATRALPRGAGERAVGGGAAALASPGGRPAPPPAPVEGWSVLRLDDQHAYLELPPSCELAVGDLVGLGISHPCTTFDKWPALLLVDDDGNLLDLYRTYF